MSKKPPYIVGFDQALSNFGTAVIDLETLKPVYLHSFQTKEIGIKRLRDIRDFTQKILRAFKPVVVAREGIVYSKFTADALKGKILDMAGIAANVDVWIDDAGYSEEDKNYYIIPPLTWKKYAFGIAHMGKKNDIPFYLSQIFKITGMRFENDNICDAYFIAKFAAVAVKLLKGKIRPWTLKRSELESFIDHQYCKKVHTSAKVVAGKIMKGKNLDLFKAYFTFNTPTYGAKFPADDNNKWGASIIATDRKTMISLAAASQRRRLKKKTEKDLAELEKNE